MQETVKQHGSILSISKSTRFLRYQSLRLFSSVTVSVATGWVPRAERPGDRYCSYLLTDNWVADRSGTDNLQNT